MSSTSVSSTIVAGLAATFLMIDVFAAVVLAAPIDSQTYSIATGRGSIMRPGFMFPFDEGLDDFMVKRSAALGRVGWRPAKRSMAMGRVGFRPGKRSIATGRHGFRPGKRALDALMDDTRLNDLEDQYEPFGAYSLV